MESNKEITMVLVEDNVDFAQTVEAFLANDPIFKILSLTENEKDFKNAIALQPPDIALIDIHLDTPKSGLDLLLWLKENYPQVKPIIMTVNEDDVLKAFQHGARSYIFKSNLELLKSVIHDVYLGNMIISPEIAGLFVSQLNRSASFWKRNLELKIFSYREVEIMKLLNNGMDKEKISDKLCISFNTVRRHIQNIIDKSEENSINNVIRRYSDILIDA